MSTGKSRLSVPSEASPVAQWKRMLSLQLKSLTNTLSSHPVMPYAVALLVAVGVRLPTLNNSIIFIDEPSYLVEAARLDTPGKFFYFAQYLTETKFPLGLVPYLVALWLNESHAILWMHIFGLLAVVASTVLLVALSHRAFRSYVPGVLAVILWCIFLTKDGLTMAPMLEYFQAPLVLAALWVCAGWVRAYSAERLLRRRQLLSLVGAGVLIGVAALVKPPAILVAPVLAVGVFFTAAGDGASLRARLYAAAAPLAGATAAIGVFVLPYLFVPDAMRALLFNLVGLTTRYASAAHQASLITRATALLQRFDLADMVLVVLASAALTLIVGVVRLGMVRGRWGREERLENVIRLVLLGSGLALFAGYLAGETKDHYIVAILPPLALYAWSVIILAYKLILTTYNRVAYTAAWVWLILMSVPGTYPTHVVSLYSSVPASGRAYAALLPGVNAQTLAATIASRSRPGDTIWVYYNAPEIYWLANRKPATDEPVGTWLVDYYNQFWFQRTLQQLEQERPTIIVGFDSPRYVRPRAANVLALPLIGPYIQSHYTCSRATPAEVGGPAGVELCTLLPSAAP